MELLHSTTIICATCFLTSPNYRWRKVGLFHRQAGAPNERHFERVLMIEPDILSVAELAARWNQTPLQIINHARSLKVPLYFQFEGLAFEERDDLDLEEVDSSQLTPTEIIELSLQQEQRAIKRNRCQYRGYLRTPPSTLWSMASTGTALLPSYAFHPLSRISIGTLPDRPVQVWEGHKLRLEPGLGCKNTLTIDDLSIPMLEVKAIEAFQKSKQPDAVPQQPAPEQEAAQLIAALGTLAKISEVDELAARIEKLEAARDAA